MKNGKRKTESGNFQLSVFILPLLLLNACPNPLTAELVRELKDDPNSFCANATFQAGGVGAMIGAGLIPAGGYGSTHLTIGRTGKDDMQVWVSANGDCAVLSQDRIIPGTTQAQTVTGQGLGTGALIAPPPKDGSASNRLAEPPAPQPAAKLATEATK